MKPQRRYKPGDKICGRYQVHKAIVGGMGEVYLCLDLEENYPLALKTFQQCYLTNPKLRKAFENEITTWVALEKHPNIVRCFRMDVLDHQPFMLLEWIANNEYPGTDLRSWLRQGSLDLRLTLDLTIDMCRGLSHAQQKQPGIVHRDLKPGNILIAQGRIAKITDFGLAKIAQDTKLNITANTKDVERGRRQNLTSQEGIVGTPPYMAPEQWNGEALDVRTDIYAIGCMVFEMLTGTRPFQATTIEEFRDKHLKADIPKLSSQQTLPDTVDILLKKCLAKQRGKRFSSIDELLQQLILIYQQQFSRLPKPIPTCDEFTAIDYNNRGFTYSKLGRENEALEDFTRAIELGANLVEVYVNRGGTYSNLQQYDKALEDFTQAIKIDSTFIGIYLNRAHTYTKLQEYDKALADYNHAIQLNPTHTMAYVDRGNTYNKMRRYDEALTDLTHALQLDSTCVMAYVNRGDTYHNLQYYDKALSDFTRAIQLDLTYTKSYIIRGIIYGKLQRYTEALTDFNRAIQLDPTDAISYYNRAKSYDNLRRYEKSVQDYSEAIRLDPSYPQFYRDRGYAYSRLQRYQESLADYTQAIQMMPNDAQLYYDRGILYAAYLKQPEQALTDFTSAIELNPEHVSAYTDRGSVYCDLQQYEKGLSDYEQAIKLDPSFARAHYNIGAMLANHDMLQEALPYLKKAAQLGFPQGVQYAEQIRKKVELQNEQQGKENTQ